VTTADPDPIVREVYVEATPETVFEFFVDPGKLRRWLAVEATVDARPGGVCHQVHTDDGHVFHMQGEFVAVEPPTRVVFTWGFVEPEVNVPVGSTTVEVSLTPEGSGTRVRLVHHDLPPSEVAAHVGGWTAMLDRLAGAAAAIAATTTDARTTP
jgi:uncharacterized protein YndB with AHSA1/START domain